MLDFVEVNISDKKLFDRFLQEFNAQASELSFTNIFMWRHHYGFRYTVIDEQLCIAAFPDNGEPFALLPVGNYSKDAFIEAVSLLKEHFEAHGYILEFRRVEEERLEYFKDIVNKKESIIFDRDNSDYIYLSKDLIELSGKKFDGKRNHISKFKKLHNYEYVNIGEENIEECHRVVSEWSIRRSFSGQESEKLANTELLNNYMKLSCKGCLIRVDGRFEAFTVGEKLNRDTAVIHIEKAHEEINGLYTLINQQFCENEWSEVQYINREQDIGIEGMRKAKLSYSPVKMINKYRVIIN